MGADAPFLFAIGLKPTAHAIREALSRASQYSPSRWGEEQVVNVRGVGPRLGAQGLQAADVGLG